MINIEALLDTGGIKVQKRVTVYDVDWTECYAEDVLDRPDLEPVLPTDLTKTYSQIVLDSDPVHYWKFGEASGSALDYGSQVDNGTYFTGTTIRQDTSLLVDGTGYSVGLGGTTKYVTIADTPFHYTAGHTYLNGTFEFLFELDSDLLPGEHQVIFGARTVPTGAAFNNANHDFWFTVFEQDGANWICFGGLPTEVYGTTKLYPQAKITSGVPHHIVGVLRDGLRTLFIDGFIRSQVTRVTLPKTSVTAQMYIGHSGSSTFAYETAVMTPTFRMDEVAIYDKALPQAEITRHYIKAIVGYDTPPGGYTSPVCNGWDATPPDLINGRDVSDYVESYSIEKDSTNLINSCMILCHEDWAFDQLKEVFKSNAYIKIEERYLDINHRLDTDWVSIGHFLCEGPMSKNYDGSDGRKGYQVSAKGLLKLATLDNLTSNIEPDRIKVPYVEAEQSVTTETVVYKIPRPNYPGLYYENWAEYPSVRIKASDFPPINGIDGLPDIVTALDELRIKGAEGSVQVVAGAGEVVIDVDYFNSAVKDYGLGQPGTIELEVHRFATSEDIFENLEVDSVGTTYSGGDPVDTWLAVIPIPDNMAIQDEEFIGRTLTITANGAFNTALGKQYKIRKVTQYVSGPNTGIKFSVIKQDLTVPDSADEGFGALDTIQVTDANTIAMALSKVLKKCGFQNNDATKPFFFDLEDPALTTGNVLIPPIKQHYESGKTHIDVISEILQFAPPNYVLYEDATGVVRARSVIQKPVGEQDHTIDHVLDVSQDRSDFGIFTRVIATGGAVDSVNVGLHNEAGGTSYTGAYKLTNFDVDYAGAGPSETGSTLSQVAADAVIKQISNGDPKTPKMTTNYSGITWDIYGSIWVKYDTSPTTSPYNCRVFEMEDSDLFWMDLGTNLTTGTEFEIDQIQVTAINPFLSGSVINQTLFIYYMTEADYILASGTIPGSTAGSGTIPTVMATLANDASWRLLVDEFACSDSQTTINANDFLEGRPQKLRFIKVKVGQPFHRPSQSATPFPNTTISHITLSDFKVWTSRKIVQTAELGVTPPFDTLAYKALKARLRRRTFLAPKNPYLDNAAKVHDFALSELQERFTEFSPKTLTCIYPTVDIYDTIIFKDPDTGEEFCHVVKGISHPGGGPKKIIAVDYTIYTDIL